jgi:DNA-directed RNA polymerase subunit alpha
LHSLSIPAVKCVESAGNYGRFTAEPLDPGFGTTLGNTMRRILLSALPGAAVTWIKIEGIQHEFTCIPYVKEDVTEFMLNVKELRLKSLSRQPGMLTLDAKGEGEVRAAEDSSEAELHAELNVELGRGYVPAELRGDLLPVGALPLDAIYTPIRKANFSVESVRPGEEKSPERLILEVWSDGTISPWEAVSQSADILIDQLSSFRELEIAAVEQVGIINGLSISPEKYNMPLLELNLSTRAYNSLRRGDILTLGQLLERSREGLPPLPGFGAKSQREVEEVLAGMGFALGAKGKGKAK